VFPDALPGAVEADHRKVDVGTNPKAFADAPFQDQPTHGGIARSRSTLRRPRRLTRCWSVLFLSPDGHIAWRVGAQLGQPSVFVGI